VPGDGTVPAAVVFVGLAPGRLGGDRTGIPFSGDRSGQLLRQMIARSGLERVFITNLVRCNPRDAEGRNRDPTPDEILSAEDISGRNWRLLGRELSHASAAWRGTNSPAAKCPLDPGRANPCKSPGYSFFQCTIRRS
jgi:hypothetical protein